MIPYNWEASNFKHIYSYIWKVLLLIVLMKSFLWFRYIHITVDSNPWEKRGSDSNTDGKDCTRRAIPFAP